MNEGYTMEKELMGEKLRRFIHPVVLKALSMRRNFRLEVQGSIPKGQQFIFIANHYGVHDLPTLAEIIGGHFFVLASDDVRGTVVGLAFDINGVVWVDRWNKEDRKKSKVKLLRHLRLGHSLVIYPESTWNLSPNLPMLPMHFGCISISLQSGVPILPIYLHFMDGVCHVDINTPFHPPTDKLSAIRELRDIMATSAWKYYEADKPLQRKTLDMDYWEDNIADRFAVYEKTTRKNSAGFRQSEAQLIFRPKGQASFDEVFAHLDHLIPSRENAFLFRKRF
jgi:1-acyl-sn-glycerol-3-phosphate acyltransferase